MDKIKRLIDEERFMDAASVAVHLKETKRARTLFSKSKVNNNEKFDAFEILLLADAPTDFDAYCRYLDYRQPLHRNFYLDRRKYLKEIADELTRMFFPIKGIIETDVLRIKLRTRSGKSEFFNRFAIWVQSNFTNGQTLTVVGGGALKNNIHSKRLAFVDEYWDRHTDVFPNIKFHKQKLEESGVWFEKREYADITTVTIGGSIEGYVQVTNLLILDDLVSSNEVNSVKRLEEIYETDIMSSVMRRFLRGKYILIGTPFATLTGIKDPMDRFLDNRRSAGLVCKEFSIPSLDENDESNYAYRDFANVDENGVPDMVFDTKSLLGERTAAYESKDEVQIATFETTYQMKPMEHGHRIFAQIRTFDKLPDGRFKYLTWFDPADSGKDAAVLHYGRIYDSKPEIIYIMDIFRSTKPMDRSENGGFLDDMMDFIIKHEIHKLEYESNMGGTLLGETLSKMAKSLGHMFSYEAVKQSKNKVQRILDHQAEIKRVIRLWDESPTEMYAESARQIRSWSEKSKHDDDIDSLTSLVERTLKAKVNKNEVILLNKPLF